MSLKKKEVAVRDIIKENISELMPLMKDKGISFKAEVKSPCDSLWVLCDPTRIAQVIGSLVRNSVDFVEDKVGKITIRGELIENERISNTNKQIIITLTKCKLLWQITAQIFHPIKQKTFSKKF
ncbi:MAG: sensor histidine kinase [Nitrososphaerales archaeon]